MTTLVPVAGAEMLDIDQATVEGRLTVAWLRSQPAPGTRAAYAFDLKEWVGWWVSSYGDRPMFTATRADGDAYRDWLTAKGLAAGTVSRKLSSVSSWFIFAEDEGYVDRNPFARVKRPRISKDGVTDTLTLVEARALLNAARADGPRSHLLVALLLTGMRCAEATNMRWSNLGTYGSYLVLRFRAKGGTEMEVPVTPTLREALDRQTRPGGDGWMLTGGSAAGNLDDSSARCVLARIAKAAGIERRVHPHMTRVAAVNLSLDAGVPIHRIPLLTGHKSVDTCMIYARRGEVINASHPAFALSAVLAG